MNGKYGRDPRYRDFDKYGRDPRYRDFETSGPDREPREPYGETYTRGEPPGYRGESARGRYDGIYAPAYSPEWAAERRGGYAGRGPKNYTRTDERIREDVCDRLSWNDEVDATDVSVHVTAAEVTLEGTVETRHMKRLAEDIAEDVPGVIDVHNTLRVSKPVLTELKEKLTGASSEHHYANTGTKATGSVSRNGVT